MKIYISGLYSGTNPQPGVGLARSLRQAYPNAVLVGVEYSNRSSGIHWPDLDELWLQRPWEELNLDAYAAQIKGALDSGALWVSGVDLEIMWLASAFPEGHQNLLTPPAVALRKVSKPAVEAHRGLPVRIPTFISTELSDWELHAFCREHDWKVWLKGPYYEAVRTPSWDVFERVRALLTRAWSTERLFLQSHVTGYEESVCFCAYRGELAGCVYMRKRELTEEGKTWAGDVTDVPAEFATPLRKIVKELNWTGGAELEMVRDMDGQLWLIECNPRFPAWVHGSTIAGRNLPALLVETATGIPAQKAPAAGEEFTRVVLEVPVRSQFPLPPLAEPFPGGVGHSLKHPSGMLTLAKRLRKLNIVESNSNGGRGKREDASAPAVPPSFVNDLKNYDLAEIETPGWLFLENTAASLFKQAANLANNLSTSDIRVTNAYSIKTNPDERLLRLALESGFLAEAISLLEVQKALNVGFKPEQVILNGPGKWWPEGLLPREPLRGVFCDSVADLRRVAASLERKELQSKIVGVRLRTPNINSRFGIPVDTPDALRTLVEAVETLPRDSSFGVHFHMASSNVGVRQWWHLYESMLRWCRSIETLAGREIECLDVGGGWFPDDWHQGSADRFAGAVHRAQNFLPHVEEVISEPGKAMAQPTMALAMRLLEFDETQREIKEAVVDGSIAELPMHFFQPHRILHRDARTREWRPLRRGQTQLLGRLCMEHDVVASDVELPEGARVGDVLIFCDAGAYDRSMSYVFGRG
ncbi:MAG TPA: ATP-grasp domain-containing protein [Pyrinomonadaceae bacterium]|nr:ATP-grasp domain-containing protein [Pyrinomonadaceae bacterium]